MVSAVEEEDAAVWEAVKETREYWAAGFGVPPEAREAHTGAIVFAASQLLRANAAQQLEAVERTVSDVVKQREDAYTQLRALREVLANAHNVMATSATDWGRHAGEAWLYGVFVGWECDQPCEEFWGRAHRCDESLLIMVRRHGWSDAQVARLRELRAIVRAARP